MAKKHKLKCWTEYFDSLKSGEKTAEVRYNDRDYQKGDTLEIEATHRIGGGPDSTRIDHLYFEVTHVLSGKPFMGDGYVMLSLKRLKSVNVVE